MATTNIPVDLKYTRTDEWVKTDGGEVLVGITDYAQNALSDLVFVELPQVGDKFDAGSHLATVESVKAASDVNMPVSGTIVAINSALETAPEQVNQEPYGKGWFVRVKPSNPTEINALLDATAYEKLCAERE